MSSLSTPYIFSMTIIDVEWRCQIKPSNWTMELTSELACYPINMSLPLIKCIIYLFNESLAVRISYFNWRSLIGANLSFSLVNKKKNAFNFEYLDYL